MRNIMVVRAVLRSRETTCHPKIGQIHTYLGSKSVGIDTKCGTGRCCAGGGYCYAPFGPSGAIWASGLATAAMLSARMTSKSFSIFSTCKRVHHREVWADVTCS